MTQTLDELDALCAERIMNALEKDRGKDGIWLEMPHPIDNILVKSWQPTRNIAQAFEVLGKFEFYSVGKPPGLRGDKLFVAIIMGAHAYEETLSLAIVKAALAAMGALE